MASRRTAMLDALVSRIGDAAKPAALVTVEKYRTRALPNTALAAAIVYPVRETVRRANDHPRSQVVGRTLTAAVEIRVRDEAGDPLDEVLDPVLAWVVQQVLQDDTLGGLASGVQERSTEWSAASAERPYGAAVIEFEVTYQTRANDPEARS